MSLGGDICSGGTLTEVCVWRKNQQKMAEFHTITLETKPVTVLL
jgi:hypothetical protein